MFLFFIYLVSDFLAVRFSVSSGCVRRRSVSTYAAILVLLELILKQTGNRAGFRLPALVPVSAPPNSLVECLFFIFLVSDFLAI